MGEGKQDVGQVAVGGNARAVRCPVPCTCVGRLRCAPEGVGEPGT